MEWTINESGNETRAEFPAFQHGEIKYLERDADYGVIESSDGRYVYFECGCVIGVDFFRLQAGDRVVYCLNSDRRLPQATNVYLSGSHAFQEW